MPDTPSESVSDQALQLENEQLRTQLHESEDARNQLEAENRELRQKLQYAEEKFEQIVDQDPQIGWVVYNESLDATYMNQGMTKLTGRTVDEFNNTPEEDIFASAEEMERIRRVRADLIHLDEKALFRSRVHLKRKDGSIFWGEFISQ
ncbi:MAG: PAS domain S-box protein, partial [SAR324 cluster bacterium]|nr:PAS domain S-box protein [SAR324 cluster bacterium]